MKKSETSLNLSFMNQFIRKVNMTDKTKYKSVAIDNDCYKKIEELSTSLIPGIEAI